MLVKAKVYGVQTTMIITIDRLVVNVRLVALNATATKLFACVAAVAPLLPTLLTQRHPTLRNFFAPFLTFSSIQPSAVRIVSIHGVLRESCHALR